MTSPPWASCWSQSLGGLSSPLRLCSPQSRVTRYQSSSSWVSRFFFIVVKHREHKFTTFIVLHGQFSGTDYIPRVMQPSLNSRTFLQTEALCQEVATPQPLTPALRGWPWYPSEAPSIALGRATASRSHTCPQTCSTKPSIPHLQEVPTSSARTGNHPRLHDGPQTLTVTFMRWSTSQLLPRRQAGEDSSKH